MRRIVVSAVGGVAALLVVSIGLCQTLPRPLPPSNAPFPHVSSDGHKSSPAVPTTVLPELTFTGQPNGKPPPAFAHPAVTTSPAPSGEKMTVKVYSVPDLVAAIQLRPTAPSPFAGIPELAVAMQQAQLQVQLAQSVAQPIDAPDVPDETTKKLERLKKALRVAAPKKTWTEEGGEGEIEVYPEALCLIVRQTASGHEAISDLLTQLRATQNIQIELSIEMVSFDGVADDVAAEALKMLNRELSADELVQFRKCGVKTALTSVVRMANGRSASSGLSPGLPLQFTAVTGADHGTVEFRTDLPIALGADDAAEMAVLSQALSQARTVAAGKTLAFTISPDGGAVLLVTPKVIDRSVGAPK